MEHFFTIDILGRVNWVLETTEKPYYYTGDVIVNDLLVVFTKYTLHELHTEDAFLGMLKENLENSEAFNVWAKVYKRDPSNIHTRATFKNILRSIVRNAVNSIHPEDNDK